MTWPSPTAAPPMRRRAPSTHRRCPRAPNSTSTTSRCWACSTMPASTRPTSRPGCGTALGVVAGALEVLASAYRFEAVGGTSGGGLVALALATGMTPRDASEIGALILVRKDLLDHHLPFLDEKTGLFRGQKIEGILQDIFGNARMGDLQTPARVTVSSMWTRKPAVVCSVAHPDVLVWRQQVGIFRAYDDPKRVVHIGTPGMSDSMAVVAGGVHERHANPIQRHDLGQFEDHGSRNVNSP